MITSWRRPDSRPSIAALFATELRGSPTNVIGLPLAEVVADLRAAGALPNYPPPGFGAPA